MAGLIELMMNPAQQGLLNLSAGLLQAGGPSRTPVSFGQALGPGLQQGTQGFQQAQQHQVMNRLHGLQAGALEQNLKKQQQTQGALLAFAETLPPEQRQAFLAAPDVFIKERFAPYTLKPGEERRVGDKVIATAAPEPKLVDMPVPGSPGVSQPAWVVPGQAAGTAIGGQKMPEILNPAVVAARKDVAQSGAPVVNVNSFVPASEAAQRDFMDKTAKTYDALKGAPVMLGNISKAKDIAASGNPFIGSFGTQKAAVAQFFNNNLGTSIAPDQIADAGELKNRLFQQIMDNLKKMDAAPSQMQQQLMMEALGNLNTDPKALTQIMSVTEEIIRGKVAVHNKEVADAEKRGVKFPFNPMVDLGPTSSSAPMTAMPTAKQHKGRIIEDSSGKRYKSDGMKWQPI
jgi:hypothetical protein